MSGWTYADVFENVARCIPDQDALIHNGERRSWSQFDAHANALAQFLLDAEISHQGKIAFYLYNRPEYLELFYACSKASLVHVNTNYRYTDEELRYIWDDADAECVAFQGSFTTVVDRIRDQLPAVHLWLWVDDGTDTRPSWAVDYADARSTSTTGHVRHPEGRSGDDLLFIYTGGTTGMPKGVMWRQADLFAVNDRSNRNSLPIPPDLDEFGVSEAVRRRTHRADLVSLPACPLMHGAGLLNSLNTLGLGGSIVTLPGTSFDAEETLTAIERERVKSLFIVGDAFARPLIALLDANPNRWDISTLRVVISSGVMWSAESKDALLRHNPRLILVDAFGSTEAFGVGSSVATSEQSAKTATFKLNSGAVVIDDDDRAIEPGSDRIGRIAIAGACPVGYYKDAEKTATTFPVIDGIRYSVPGDFATVEADGSITLLGRGSVCINTGGEKVFPEEVEEVLKQHPSVSDAAVVGVPDERFGQIVVAVIQPINDNADEIDDKVLIDHTRHHLARYKAPRRIHVVESLGRAANGKLDYGRLARFASSVEA